MIDWRKRISNIFSFSRVRKVWCKICCDNASNLFHVKAQTKQLGSSAHWMGCTHTELIKRMLGFWRWWVISQMEIPKGRWQKQYQDGELWAWWGCLLSRLPSKWYVKFWLTFVCHSYCSQDCSGYFLLPLSREKWNVSNQSKKAVMHTWFCHKSLSTKEKWCWWWGLCLYRDCLLWQQFIWRYPDNSELIRWCQKWKSLCFVMQWWVLQRFIVEKICIWQQQCW